MTEEIENDETETQETLDLAAALGVGPADSDDAEAPTEDLGDTPEAGAETEPDLDEQPVPVDTPPRKGEYAFSSVSAWGHGLGHVPDDPDPRDWKYDHTAEPDQTAPTHGGLWPFRLPPIWNQQTIGSCTAHGSLRGFVHALMRQGVTLPPTPTPVPDQGNPAPFSRLQQYWDSRDLEGTTATDSGAQVRDAIKALAKFGVAPETIWPYNVANFAVEPPQNARSLALKNVAVKYESLTPNGQVGGPEATALTNGKGIVFGFQVPQYFEEPDGDISWDPASGTALPLPPSGYSNYIGGHCVFASYFNYGDEPVDTPFGITLPAWSLLIDNSWDVTWGIGGRFVMSSEWFTSPLTSDFWIIDVAT